MKMASRILAITNWLWKIRFLELKELPKTGHTLGVRYATALVVPERAATACILAFDVLQPPVGAESLVI